MNKFKSDVEIVESFIQRLRDSDIIIDQNARNIPFIEYKSGETPQKRNLADLLALMIETYNEQKDGDFRDFAAKTCARWIDKAYTFGVVNEGEGLTRKLRECMSERERLQKTIDEISERNIQLEFENQDLHSKLEESERYQRIFRQANQ